MMNGFYRIHAGLALLTLAMLSASGSPLAAQASGGGVAISGFGGFTNDPGGFDVFRDTEFDAAYHVGAALAFRLGPNTAVRGDYAKAWSSGQETSVLSGESVNFNRVYYGVAVELRLPLASVTPYLLLGGGMVTVDRTAPSRNYTFSEFAGRIGGGLAYRFPGSPVEAFFEGSGWSYERASTGEGRQFDTTINVGLSFIPDL